MGGGVGNGRLVGPGQYIRTYRNSFSAVEGGFAANTTLSSLKCEEKESFVDQKLGAVIRPRKPQEAADLQIGGVVFFPRNLLWLKFVGSCAFPWG